MKKFVLMLLSLSMLISSTSVFAKDYSNYEQKYWDLSKDHWAYNYISELTDKNVISGYDDGSFKPENTVSRAEWATMMIVAAGLQLQDEYYDISDLPKDHWAYKYVIAAKSYMNWYSADNTTISFRPNQAASREDVAVSLVKLKGYSVDDVDYSELSSFKDTDSISNNLKKYIAVALQKHIISGYDDNTFRGQDSLTRAEAATLLCRAFQMGNDDKVVDFDEFFNKKDTDVLPHPTQTPKSAEETITEPTPQPTEEPTTKPTVKSAFKDCNDPTVTAEQFSNSRYEVQTLTDSVTLPSPDFYTYDTHDNVYYFDEGIIKRVNMITRETYSMYDINEYPILTSEGTTKIARLKQIFYDRESDKLYLYASIPEEDEPVLIRVEDGGGVIVKYQTDIVKDKDDNYYTVNKFIGISNGNLLYSAKCNSGSYCHAVMTGKDWQNGIILDPINDQELRSYYGYRDSGYNSCNLTTFVAHKGGGYTFASYNDLFRYDSDGYAEKITETVTNQFIASFINENGYFTMYGEEYLSLCLDTKLGNATETLVGITNDKIVDGKLLDVKSIMPVCIVSSNYDFAFYDKLNGCFRIATRCDNE